MYSQTAKSPYNGYLVKKLQQFVANGVDEIHRLSYTWNYCPIECNPVDLLNRGISPQCLKTASLVDSRISVAHLECQESLAFAGWRRTSHRLVEKSYTTIPGNHNITTVSNYSTLWRLLHVSVYALRFMHNAKHPSNHKEGALPAKGCLLWDNCICSLTSLVIYIIHQQLGNLWKTAQRVCNV